MTSTSDLMAEKAASPVFGLSSPARLAKGLETLEMREVYLTTQFA